MPRRVQWAALLSPVSQASVRTIISLLIHYLNNPEGKTCFLYYVLVLRLIQAQPTIFQDDNGSVFTIAEHVSGSGHVDGDDILALVDADGEQCKPSKERILSKNSYRVLLTSSPRNEKDRDWMKQYCPYTGKTLVMNPCSWEELMSMAFVFALCRFRFLTTYADCLPFQFTFPLPVSSRRPKSAVPSLVNVSPPRSLTMHLR
jgi:hypothetical protein